MDVFVTRCEMNLRAIDFPSNKIYNLRKHSVEMSNIRRYCTIIIYISEPKSEMPECIKCEMKNKFVLEVHILYLSSEFTAECLCCYWMVQNDETIHSNAHNIPGILRTWSFN